MTLPILYSLQNCPYAMRARLALYKSGQEVAIREVKLKDKPQSLLDASAKATVPVLVLPTLVVIDESLDVMLWALNKTDPDNLMQDKDDGKKQQMLSMIKRFDQEFKPRLEQYKCAKRYKEDNLAQCRSACESYLVELEQRLSQHAFIFSQQESLVDIAILPFIRQFARVERQWYLQQPYPHLKCWLNNYLQSKMFSKVMTKQPVWCD